jgi:hypothetical protein
MARGTEWKKDRMKSKGLITRQTKIEEKQIKHGHICQDHRALKHSSITTALFFFLWTRM